MHSHPPAPPPTPSHASPPDEETALISRLYTLHASPADIARILSSLSGRSTQSTSTIEEAQLLRRLSSLHVSPEDLALVVAALRRGDNNPGAAELRDAPPPIYDFKGN